MLRVANAVVRRIANLAYSFPFTRPLRRGSLLKKVLPGGQVHLSRCSWTPWKAGTAGFGPSESGLWRPQAATSRLTFCPVAVIRASELTLSSPLSLNFPKRCDSLTSANSVSTYAARLGNALRKASVSRYDLTLFRYSPPSRGSTSVPSYCCKPPDTFRSRASRMKARGHPRGYRRYDPRWFLLPVEPSREEVYELQVLELGGEGGGELGTVPLIAHLVGDLEEGGHGARRRHVATFQGDDRAAHLRVLLDGDEHEVAGSDRPDHGRPRQESDPEPMLDHPLGRLDVVHLHGPELPYPCVS